jgi:hypothetical protein
LENGRGKSSTARSVPRRQIGKDGRVTVIPRLRPPTLRHGRACPGHPRLQAGAQSSASPGTQAFDGTRLAVELLAAELPNPCGCQGRAFQARRRRRSPQAILDSRSGLENGRDKSSTARRVPAGGGPGRKSAIVHAP